MEKVKGFKNLTKNQQDLLIKVNAKHKSGVGMDEKDGFTPIAVKPSGANIRVFFKNGMWLNYTPKGEWY